MLKHLSLAFVASTLVLATAAGSSASPFAGVHVSAGTFAPRGGYPTRPVRPVFNPIGGVAQGGGVPNESCHLIWNASHTSKYTICYSQ
jgi:hypothetical protein